MIIIIVVRYTVDELDSGGQCGDMYSNSASAP